MDADFSHQLVTCQVFSFKTMIGFEVVTSWGGTEKSALRKVISQGGSLYARTILGLSVRDLTGGFKCFRREVLESIDLTSVESTGYSFQIELTYRAAQNGFRIKEVPIVFFERVAGNSKMSGNIVLEAVTKVWKIRFS